MKISICTFLIIMASSFSLSGQNGDSLYIRETFDDLTFEEFAQLVKNKYSAKIFFKDDWVEGLRVSSKEDSILLSDFLDKILEPRNIKFTRRYNNQFFLTGNKTPDPFETTGETIISQDEPTVIPQQDNDSYYNFRFEEGTRKVIFGSPLSRNNSSLCKISGRISASSTEEPITGATISIKGTNKGVISDRDGNYSLLVDPGSTITINVSYLGMQPKSYLAEVYNSGNLDIELSENLIDIEEVVVTYSKEDNVYGMQMGFQRMGVKEIKQTPMAFGEADILRLANMTPGVQFSGEGSSGINVRGSSSDQNLFLVNEIPVLNTGHMFGFFSAFNADMINDFTLYKSNFPAEYGGRLSSIFDISTKAGSMEKFGVKGNVNPITGSLVVETPLVKNKISFIAGIRSTYSDWILSKIDDPMIRNSKASFKDFMVGVDLLGGNNSSLKLFGYKSEDYFTLSNSNDFHYGNTGASLTYNRNFGENWMLKVAGVFSQYSNYHTSRFEPSKAYENEFYVKSREIKMNFTGFPWNNHRVGFGGGAIHYDLNQGSYNPIGDLSLMDKVEFGKEFGTELSFFAFDEVKLSDRFTFYGGIRYSSYRFLGPNECYTYKEDLPKVPENRIDTILYSKGENIFQSSGPEYRIALNYLVNQDLSVKISMNRMRQYLFMLSNTIAQSPIDRWKLSDTHIAPPVSDQISIGLFKNFREEFFETSFEVYLKKDRNIVEYIDGADITSSPDFESYILQGENNSYGAEIMFVRTEGKISGWLSYTFSRTMTKVDGKYEWEKINNGIPYPSNFDKPHSLNIVFNYRFSRRLSFGSNLEYSTGRPITYPTELFYTSQFQIINYSSRNEYRIPDYFRLDASINIEGNLQRNKLFHGSWSFSIYNLTGRRNAYSVYFKNEDGRIKGYKQSIFGIPVFTISYNFKLGNYATE